MHFSGLIVWIIIPIIKEASKILAGVGGTSYLLLRGLDILRWLKEEKGIGVFVEPPVKKELLEYNSYFSCVQSCDTGAQSKDMFI